MGWQTLSNQRKLLICDLTLADNIGGTCKVEILDGAPLEIYVYNELAAGHIDPDLPAADFSHQGKGGDNTAGSRAAGIGEVLHTPLKGTFKDLVLTGKLTEVDVSALGKFGIEADLAPNSRSAFSSACAKLGYGTTAWGSPGFPNSK